jgi:PadR family transcriptional regulator, regulatory protein PadR
MGDEASSGPSPPAAFGRPRNWLQPFLLLSLEQWQSHGYELMRRMAVFGFEALDTGSVYRMLRALEKEGLVSSYWDTSSGGPARRLYSITDAGRDYLGLWAAALRSHRTMLDQFFTLYPPLSATARPGEDAPIDAPHTRSTHE